MVPVLSQEEMWQSILTPLLEQFGPAPHLVEDLMYNYTQQHMSKQESLIPSSIETWKSLCTRILDSAELARWAGASSLEQSRREVVGYIVFAWLSREWPHAALFREIVDQWVTVIGYNPDAYPSLVIFLRGPGWIFVPEPALEWISRCITASSQRQQFWQAHRNAERTARLLQHMWDSAEDKIRGQPTTLKSYADLVDQLVGAGVPLASVLQQKRETRE